MFYFIFKLLILIDHIGKIRNTFFFCIYYKYFIYYDLNIDIKKKTDEKNVGSLINDYCRLCK